VPSNHYTTISKSIHLTQIQTRPKLILINPVSQYRKGLALKDHDVSPPLCLSIIAALTPKHWKIRILDENYQEFRYHEADLIGITAYTPNAYRAYEIARVYREKGIPVVMGGIHASMCTEEAMKFVDSVVVGEAEDVWPEVLSDFESGSLKKMYRGTYSDLHNQPIPRNDLYDPRYVWRSVQTSRGCPMNCDFCSVTSFNGGRFRTRPTEQVVEELRAFHGDRRNIFFVDDNIGGVGPAHYERTIGLFEGIIRSGMKFNWFSQTSLNIAGNEEVLRLAARSGCRLLLIGMEAETEEALGSANKRTNLKEGVENYRRSLNKIRRHGIGVLGTFIFGMESDKPEDVLRRAKWIKKLNVDGIQTSILTPFPGTKLSKRMQENGSITCRNFPHDWQYFNWEDIVHNHPNIGSEDLARLMTRSWHMFYDPMHLHVRFLRTLFGTRSLETAIWSYAANRQYRSIMFERDIHFCT
jgi:radical SAM superfamily enzyme YgiQ (UPF0313 family)